MKILRFTVIAFFIAFTMSSCSSGHIVAVPQLNFGKIDVTTVEKAVLSALARLRWFVADQQDGKIFAEYRRRKITVNIVISYSDSSLKIEHVSSTNLRYREENGVKYVHKIYNGWMRKLEREIRHRINLARVEIKQPTSEKSKKKAPDA